MTMDSTVTLIVLLLIILTIGFETAKEHIEEAADHNKKPIIASLFGEMTVLGFLSIFTFCVTQLGYFEHLSMMLFGEEEELLETFEFVHYMLFFIMVFFVISVLTLVNGAEKTEKTWWKMNAACLDEDYMARLDAIGSEKTQKGRLAHLCQSIFPCQSAQQRFRDELTIFRGIRQEFILERSSEPFFEANPNPVANDFNFGRYLSICLGHILGHAVHLNVLAWAFFAVLTLAFFGIMVAISNSIAVSK